MLNGSIIGRPPAIGDVLQIQGHRGLLLVVEAAFDINTHTFDTITMHSFATTKGPDPKVKKFSVATGRPALPDREQRQRAEIRLVGSAPVKKVVSVSYKVGGFKAI
jgi:hypothetical protein